jgi:hypothetical protein
MIKIPGAKSGDPQIKRPPYPYHPYYLYVSSIFLHISPHLLLFPHIPGTKSGDPQRKRPLSAPCFLFLAFSTLMQSFSTKFSIRINNYLIERIIIMKYYYYG